MSSGRPPPPPIPRRQAFARWALARLGWTFQGSPPEDHRCILIGAPHTSNWDFLYLLLVSWSMGMDVKWVGKHTLFRPPFGGLMRVLGGVPVDRRARHGAVGQLADEFARRDHLILTVAPEGTRSKVPYWKSGFYEIARAAGVPIATGYLDYARKEGGIGPLVMPTGDRKADMDRLREFYADKTGKHPENWTPPRLRDESPVEPRPAG